jgi:hypothetical protein
MKSEWNGHVIALGPAISLPEGARPEGHTSSWSVRCPRCGREEWTIEQLVAEPCTARSDV